MALVYRRKVTWRRRYAALAIAATLALTACSSTDDATNAGQNSVPGESTSTSTTAVPRTPNDHVDELEPDGVSAEPWTPARPEDLSAIDRTEPFSVSAHFACSSAARATNEGSAAYLARLAPLVTPAFGDFLASLSYPSPPPAGDMSRTEAVVVSGSEASDDLTINALGGGPVWRIACSTADFDSAGLLTVIRTGVTIAVRLEQQPDGTWLAAGYLN